MVNEETNKPPVHPVEPPPANPAVESPRHKLGPVFFIAILIFAVLVGWGVYSGITARAAAETTLTTDTQQAALLSVQVVNPKPGAPTQEIQLPGNTQAFTDTPIYARTSGYLVHWFFDIGAHVKKGQLLADIETPEIDKQLQQAKADLATAQANLDLAKSTAERWQFLLKTDSVSKQETDEKVSDLSAKKAVLDSNASNVRRIEDLQSFQKVYAPFDGIITARNTDIGALIDAGANAPGKELFHMAAISRLRVYVPVPEIYSRASRTGAMAGLTLDEFPGRTFHGKLVRTSNSIDPSARTLLTEVDVDNPSGELLPGAYVFVHLKLPEGIKSVVIPANTLLFRAEGLRVGVVRDGVAQLIPVTIGRDYGNSVEIVAGLTPSDPVILNPPDSLISGTHVKTESTPQQ
jgi:RND family efflux transporter MFP subunit